VTDLSFLVPWLVVATLLYGLRQLERWLHQHIFKVGWLFTKNLQTTTTLYYAFFLPGIFLNELVRWMVAGLLDIRAERTFEWPQQQDIGELKLNFIKVQAKAPAFAVALINTVPVFVGLVIVSWIANSNLALPAFLVTVNSGVLAEIGPAFTRLTTAADFWLWFYLAFTIGNTMLPDVERLRGWRIALPIVGVIITIVVIAGAGNEFITNVMNGPVWDSLNALAGVLSAIIVLNLMGVAILGTIEALVERVTGNSATFKDNKMITMTRAELLQKREEAFQEERRRLNAPSAKPALPAAILSIYALPLPIPGAPGKEPVRQDASVILPVTPSVPLQPGLPAREEPKVIPGAAAPASALPRPAPTTPPLLSSTSSPGQNPPVGSVPTRPAFPAGPISSPAPTPAPSPGTSPARPAFPSGTGSSPAASARPGTPTPSTAGNPARPSFPPLPTSANRPPAATAPKPTDEDEEDEEVRYVDLEDSP
jgi:hypothetical protein